MFFVTRTENCRCVYTVNSRYWDRPVYAKNDYMLISGNLITGVLRIDICMTDGWCFGDVRG